MGSGDLITDGQARSEVAIIGAGPYGLSVAAYLRRAGVDTRVFGEPMESWRRHMPAGMLLRSGRWASHIADPGCKLGIEAWEAATGTPPTQPMPVEQFMSYGQWYQQQRVPDVDRRRVQSLALAPRGFSLTLEDGGELFAERIVVAAGIAPFAFWPDPFRGLPASLVSHSSQHPALAQFAGREVLVVGAGQSALETAALLHEAGAKPHLVARADGLVWLPGRHGQRGLRARINNGITPPTDVGGRISGWLAAAPGGLRNLPAALREWVTARCTVPAGAAWLPPRLEEVPLELERSVSSADPAGESLRVTLDDGQKLTVDHAILGTGYRVEVGRYGWLSSEILQRLERVNGAPLLRRGLESSIPGLHFTGAAAAPSFGPIMRFVVGTWYAAPAIARAITGTPQRPAHLSYRPRVGRG